MWEDLRINGTALSSFGAIVDFAGIKSTPPLRGGNIVYPGVPGAVWVPKVSSQYVFTVPLSLYGTDRGDFNDTLEALRALLDSSTAALDMERRIILGGVNVSQTADGDYVNGLQPEIFHFRNGLVSLDIANLSGGWT